MEKFALIFIITFVILLVSPFVLMFMKAYYHFEYLKELNPDKFKKYSNYLDTSKNILFNKYVVLISPFFKRYKNQENTKELKNLGKKISLFCKLIYYDIAFIVSYVIILILLFGDFD